MTSLERIKEEYMDLATNPLTNIGCSIGISNPSNCYEWKVTYYCGKDSIYAGGLFYVKILFPNDYPNSPPQVIFLTPIYHLNVNHKKSEIQSLGYACLHIIHWWSPNIKIREVLVQIYSIFYLQNPESPYGIGRAEEYIKNRPLFELKAKYFTQKYADPKNELQNFDDKDWDFSCSEKDLEEFKLKYKEEEKKEKEKENNNSKEDINLDFTYNAKTKITIKCGTDELMKNILEKCMNEIGKSPNLEKTLLILYGKKLDLDSSVKDNGLRNNSSIDIIHNEVDNWRIINN